ncbi:DUF6221 family protein [Streptomyces bobili]|uniref:DUF6221 family protein n=1 Tax=Streptomyces bobili TaxID=67280 RepID=UPI0037AE6794
MDELVGWLGEQLDADAVRAMEAADEVGASWRYDDGQVLADREGDMVATGSQDFLEAERGRFIAEHDPAQVLREIDAKQKTINLHAPQVAPFSHTQKGCTACSDNARSEWGADWPCLTLRLLAAPYAARPGYREEWRP